MRTEQSASRWVCVALVLVVSSFKVSLNDSPGVVSTTAYPQQVLADAAGRTSRGAP
ncbi:hypothetical protein [Corallococcus carmarthensis]|uniref:hypothetical protein n=1 Tax=Corallococcus carmarthensis TaxID=2316728 RepID=UPI00148E3B9D|nr:hypothetical protein [Corallococcus carmarthensis]NOK15894.1 hypothetical protein [Corallococcus carmarthensis]